jgi:thymidylate synthase (FAD)
VIELTSDIKVELIQSMGGDAMVVAAAKVSTTGEAARELAQAEHAEGNAGLINYLMKHRHGTPFEHGATTVFVLAPVFVWRQWHRHRIAVSYSEESARYKPLEPLFWVPRRDRAMVPVKGWKAGRPKFLTLDEAAHGNTEYADAWYNREIKRKRRAYEVAYEVYLESIKDEIAMEVSRSVLPVGIYSSCWVTCNPRSLMAFLSLRTHEETATFISYPQAEIEEAARACESLFAEGWPLTHQAFVKNGRVGP